MTIRPYAHDIDHIPNQHQVIQGTDIYCRATINKNITRKKKQYVSPHMQMGEEMLF